MKRLFSFPQVHLHLALTTSSCCSWCVVRRQPGLHVREDLGRGAPVTGQMMKQTTPQIYRDVLRYLGTAKRTTTPWRGRSKDVGPSTTTTSGSCRSSPAS